MSMRAIHIAQPVLGETEWQALKEPIESGWLTQGPKVRAFEKEFAERHQVSHALATTSCTTALHLALAALGIGPGDEVIVPAFTWVASANAVLYCGAIPVFADVDRTTNNVTANAVARALSEKTRAVIAVHLFGLCADIDAIRAVLPANIPIVEDAACAAGASYKGVPAGGLGEVGCFSFHPRKAITTGEGGMVTTNDGDLARRAEILRNHGASISEEQRHHGVQPYLLPDFDVEGFNYRMSDLQGAVGYEQLKRLDGFITEREKWAAFYNRELSDIEWMRQPARPEDGQHAWQSYVTYIDPDAAPLSRNEIMARLHAEGIATRPGTHAVHMLGFYRDRFTLSADDFPGARDCQANTMAIPLHNRMDADDYARVVASLRRIAGDE